MTFPSRVPPFHHSLPFRHHIPPFRHHGGASIWISESHKPKTRHDFCVRTRNVWWCQCMDLGEPQTEQDSARLLCVRSNCVCELAMYGASVWWCQCMDLGEPQTEDSARLATTFVCELAMYGASEWWCQCMDLGEPQTENLPRLLCANSQCMVPVNGGANVWISESHKPKTRHDFYV
jgi:hypothetical protein